MDVESKFANKPTAIYWHNHEFRFKQILYLVIYLVHFHWILLVFEQVVGEVVLRRKMFQFEHQQRKNLQRLLV